MMKRVACLFLVVLMSIESFAAIVGDSDGGAFVSKQEFEDLKTNFASQVDRYNLSLDNKIDGAIAAYLQGIKVENERIVSTGFDYVGKTRKEIRFLGQTNNGWNFSNELYARDKIDLYANGAFRTAVSHYVHDTYDNWVWNGIYERGSGTNTYFLLDKNNCVDHIYYNVRMYLNRFYGFYSDTNANDGITWNEVIVQLDMPSELVQTTSASINSTGTSATGWGHCRRAQGSAVNTTYPNDIDAWMFSSGNASSGGSATSTPNYYVSSTDATRYPYQCIITNLETKTRKLLQEQLSVSMSKNEIDYGIHICYQPTTTIHSTDKEWGKIEMAVKDKDDLQNYSITSHLMFSSGYWSDQTHALSANSRIVKGYGVKFHELLDTTKTDKPPKNTFDDVYYKELNKVWDEKKRIKYTGGFPVYKADADGVLEFRIKSDTATNIIFTDEQNDSMPATTNASVRTFDYKNASNTTWTTNVQNVNVAANTNYDFRIELFKGDIIYLNINSASGNIKVTQSGDPTFTSV